jgi:hypothetical protein
MTTTWKRREFERKTGLADAEQIFRRHYETNEWGSTESVSGPGSTAAYTENIRKALPMLRRELGIETLLDAPCGDFNWFKLIQWDAPISYKGGDIVRPLVERNQSLYGAPTTEFFHLDIVYDALPAADLWLCRDCLFHFSNDDILWVIANFFRSDIRYLLTTTHSDWHENTDISTGAFRMLNLQLPPFSFGEPLRLIDDWVEGFPVRHLALWDRDTLAGRLASNTAFRRALKSAHG